MSDIAQASNINTHAPLTVGGDVGDYIALLKPRLMSLSIFTSFVGLVAAPGSLHPFLAFVALLAIAVGAGASGALNMWYDRDIDAKMQRTAMRPIPRGNIKPNDALAYGIFLSCFSVFTLGVFVNWLAAGLLALTIFYYAVIYTMWLKRSTVQNIVIGGAAGALPPMIGWAASTGTVSWGSFSLFLLIFLWTPPHFWALSLYRADDYKRANIPMLPVVKGKDETRKQILFYTVLLLAASALPLYLGVGSYIYGTAAALLGAVFFKKAIDVFMKREGRESDKAARSLFLFSILYLFVMFSAILMDKIVAHFNLLALI